MVFGVDSRQLSRMVGQAIWLKGWQARALQDPAAWMSRGEAWRQVQSDQLAAGGFFDKGCGKARRILNVSAVIYLLLGIAYAVAVQSAIAAAVAALVAATVVLLAHPLRGLTAQGKAAYERQPSFEPELFEFMETCEGRALLQGSDGVFLAASQVVKG